MKKIKDLDAKLKLIIFDFDETLYYSPNALQCYIQFIKKTILDLSDYSEEKAMKIIKEYGFDQKGEKRVSFGKTCEKFGIPKQLWEDYKKNHFFEIDYENAQTVNNKLLRKMSKKIPLVIVSNEIYEHILYKSKRLKIDLSNFNQIYAPKKENLNGIDKQETYSKILKEYNLTPHQAIVVGDRYNVDIKPFENIGGKGVQISNTKEIESLLKYLLTFA